jgi:hypothetical protein
LILLIPSGYETHARLTSDLAHISRLCCAKRSLQATRIDLPGCLEVFPGDELLLPEHAPVEESGMLVKGAPIKRLVVLIPEAEIDEAALADKVWQLASPAGLQVYFMALVPDEEDLHIARRRLSYLALLTTDGAVKARSRVVTGADCCLLQRLP